MNRSNAFRTFQKLDNYITTCLGLDHRQKTLSPRLLNGVLLSSCAYNTYVETISDKADTLFRYIKESEQSMFTFSYLHYIKTMAKKINLPKKKVVLAFDYTNEIFWGDVQGVDIFGTKKSKKGTGAFKFLTCSQVSGKLHAKVPLISLPVRMGHNKSSAIIHCLSLIKEYVGEIELILFDREYYVKDIMMTLNHLNIPYLIFVPKKKGKIINTLNEMYTGEIITKVYEFDVNKHKTVYHDNTSMTFLKSIFDSRTGEHFDWCFVTNIKDFDVNKMIPMYKCRWRIETGFRVQDEAGCRTRSKEMIIRYFFFLYEQLLQTIWYVFYKEEISFKQFIISLQNLTQEDKQLEGSKVHVNTD
ncbi:MAG: transposase [Nanoarchaeota archaeon]|nr:transposase [Nanoarchaeota archaeon]